MKRILLAAALLLSGCASQMEPVITDRYSNVPELRRIDTKVTTLPQTPELKGATVNGNPVAVLDLEGVDQMTAFREVARKNTDALQQAVDLYNTAVERDRIMLASLRMEEERANNKERMYVEAENARRQQASESRIALIAHKLIIIVMGVAWAF